MKRAIYSYLMSKGFTVETLSRLNNDNLAKLAAEYHFKGAAYQ